MRSRNACGEWPQWCLRRQGQGRQQQPKRPCFAGGCFWCVEEAFDEGRRRHRRRSPAIRAAASTTRPTSRFRAAAPATTRRSRSNTIREVVSYEQLLDAFWRNIDPFDDRGQFCDKGSQYLSAIFVRQRRGAPAGGGDSKAEIAERNSRCRSRPQCWPSTTFYPAEDYHQDFYHTNERPLQILQVRLRPRAAAGGDLGRSRPPEAAPPADRPHLQRSQSFRAQAVSLNLPGGTIWNSLPGIGPPRGGNSIRWG